MSCLLCARHCSRLCEHKTEQTYLLPISLQSKWGPNRDWKASFSNWTNQQSPWWCSGKESTCQCSRRERCEFDPWVGKIPWRRKWQPTPVLLPEKFHGQRSLASYSPWGPKDSITTEHAQVCMCFPPPTHTHTAVFKYQTVILQWEVAPSNYHPQINTYPMIWGIY